MLGILLAFIYRPMDKYILRMTCGVYARKIIDLLTNNSTSEQPLKCKLYAIVSHLKKCHNKKIAKMQNLRLESIVVAGFFKKHVVIDQRRPIETEITEQIEHDTKILVQETNDKRSPR